MPPLMKKQKQAKQQHSSGTQYFHNGLIEDLQEIAMDPTYLEDCEDNSKTDSDSSTTIKDMSFGLFTTAYQLTNETVSDPSSDESDHDNICTGMKRKGSNNPEDVLRESEAEDTPDYMEECAWRAVISAHQFWAGIMSTVSTEIVNHIP